MRRFLFVGAFLVALSASSSILALGALVNTINPQVITLPSAEIDDQFNLGGGGGICAEWGHQIPCTNHYANTKTNTTWCTDTGFVLVSVPANVTCQNNRGLVSNNATTNVAIRSRDLTQAAWNVATFTTRALDQIGIDGVANSASSITATAGSSTSIVTQAITLGVGTKQSSAFVMCITCTGTLEMTQDGSAFTTLNSAVCFTPFGVGTNLTAGIWLRCQVPAASITNPVLGFRIQNSGDKFGIDVVQLEANVVTAPIVTTTASVARSVDNMATAGRLATILATSTGSAFGQSNNTYSTNGNFLGTNATTDVYMAQNTSVSGDIRANNTPSAYTIGGSGTWAASRVKNCTSWDSTGDVGVANNGTAVTSANALTGTSPSYLGGRNGSSVMNGPIERIAIWSWKQSSTQCKALTQ